MYIPKHQYVVKQSLTTEDRLQYEDGTPFDGIRYVQFSSGLKFDVPKEDLSKGNFSRAKRIITPAEVRNPKLEFNINTVYIPTRPVDKPLISRYFIKHKVLNRIVEVDRTTYNSLNNNEASHLLFGEMSWYVSGPVYDIKVLDMLQEGTTTKNKRQVQALEKTVPGISNYVTDFKFLSDPKYADQMERVNNSSKIILPSPS